MGKPKVDKTKYDSSFSLSNKIGRLIWSVCYYLLFRFFVTRFLSKWRVFVLRCFGANIHWTSIIYANVKIWAPWNLEMEEYSTLGPKVDCYNQGKITIKKHAIVSQKSYLCASSHDISDSKFKLILKPIVIEDEAWIAADAFIGPGVTVGKGAVVAARSAVFKDVKPWSVVGGNPASIISERQVEG